MDSDSWLLKELEDNHPDWECEAFEGSGVTFRDWILAYMPATASRFTSGMERPIGAWVVRTLVKAGIKDNDVPYGRSELEQIVGTESENIAIVKEFLRWQDAYFRVEFPSWGYHVDGVRRSQRTPFVTDHDGRGGVPTARGAHGRVIRVREEDTDDLFALKIIENQESGRRELDALRALDPETPATPHAVRLRASYTDPRGVMHLVLHPWGLCTLEQLFERAESQAWWVHMTQTAPERGMDLIFGIMLALTRCLSSLHSARLKHRDIKPSNVMLVPVGDATGWPPVRPVLCDFGTSSVLADGPSESSGDRGTRDYWSPQQVKHRRSGRKADVFSMGCVLLELLAFVCGSRAILNKYMKRSGGYSGLFDNPKHASFMADKPGFVPDNIGHEEERTVRGLIEILLPTMALQEADRPNSMDLARSLSVALSGWDAEAVLWSAGDSQVPPGRDASSSSNEDKEDDTPDYNYQVLINRGGA